MPSTDAIGTVNCQVRDMTLTGVPVDEARTTAPKSRARPVADSWEDGASSSDSHDDDDPEHSSGAVPSATSTSETDAGTQARAQPTMQSAKATTAAVLPPLPGAIAPPNTPHASRPSTSSQISSPPPPSSSSSSSTRQTQDASKRPEKTTAPAARMIAAGLGLRTKRTEEERRFDRAQREGLRRRKEEERRREEEVERVRASVWDG